MDIGTFFRAKDKPCCNPVDASSTHNTGAIALTSTNIESPATCTIRRDDSGVGGHNIAQRQRKHPGWTIQKQFSGKSNFEYFKTYNFTK